MSKKKAALALFACLGLLALFAPRIASGYAKNRVLAMAAERGVPLSIGSVALGWSSSTAQNVCVEGLNEQSLVCIDEVREFDGVPIVLRGGEADLSSQMGTFAEIRELVSSWGGARASSTSEPSAPSAQQNQRRAGPVPTITLRDFSVDVSGQPVPLTGVRVQRASFAGLDSIAADIETENLALSLFFPGLSLPSGYHIEGSAVAESQWIRVEPSEAIEFSPSDDVSVSTSAIEIRFPLTGIIETVALEVPGQEAAIVEIARLELELREFTTSIDDLFFARAELEGLSVNVDLLEGGSPAALVALGLIEDPDAPAADADGEDTDDDVEDAEADPALWEGRRWWEKIPQVIRLTDASATLSRGDEEVSIRSLEVAYAIRAVRPQLDVELTGEIAFNGEAAGETTISAEWNWATSALQLDLALTDFALSCLTVVSPDLEPLGLSGVVDLTTRVREADVGTIADFSGTLALTDFGISVGLLTERLEVPAFSYEWDAARDLEAEVDALDFTVGTGSLGEAEFSFTPRLRGFNYHRGRLFNQLDVRATVPDQDANMLLAAIPSALLGPVADTEMTGTWGYSIEFPVSWAETEEGEVVEGPRPIDIGESTVYEIRDGSLHLSSMPEEVDVRRLNRPFSFTFLGPNESINRRITARAPRVLAADANTAEEEEEPAERSNRWARLEDVSYFVTASALYREDGRFFRNSGINWYQWRAVMEQAWLDRELGRGASTISMQLVKNVFLSHERSIERKIQELILTYWMTRLVPKERVLEVYLNIIEWGPGINGIVEAADHYFGKSPGDLSLEESVWLSSIVPAPVRRGAQRSRGSATDWSLRHCRDIMEGMHGSDWITRSEADKGISAEIRFVTSPEQDAPHRRPVVDLDVSDLQDLRLTAPTASREFIGGRLGLPPQERVRSLISEQLSLRP
jgi:hypothetical protein